MHTPRPLICEPTIQYGIVIKRVSTSGTIGVKKLLRLVVKSVPPLSLCLYGRRQ